jgi:hypothetical protein
VGRKNRRITDDRDDERPLNPLGGQRRESHPDGDWFVRQVTGAASEKDYRCPGCDQVVPAGTPHVVAWSADDPVGLEHRRHWHKPCWTARNNRGPRVQRSSRAPRY